MDLNNTNTFHVSQYHLLLFLVWYRSCRPQETRLWKRRKVPEERRTLALRKAHWEEYLRVSRLQKAIRAEPRVWIRGKWRFKLSPAQPITGTTAASIPAVRPGVLRVQSAPFTLSAAAAAAATHGTTISTRIPRIYSKRNVPNTPDSRRIFSISLFESQPKQTIRGRKLPTELLWRKTSVPTAINGSSFTTAATAAATELWGNAIWTGIPKPGTSRQ